MAKITSSFTGKLIFMVMILSLVPLLIAGTYLYSVEIENEKESLKKRLESLSGVGAQNVGLWIEEKKITVDGIAKNNAIIADTKKLFDPQISEEELFKSRFNIQKHFSTSINQYDWLEELMIIDPKTGKVVFTTGLSSFPDSLEGEIHYEEAVNRKVGMSEVYSSKSPIKNELGQFERGVPTLLISAPIRGEVGLEGILTARINVFDINPTVKNFLTDFTSADLYLVNSDGYFLTSSAFPQTLIEMELIEKRAELELLLIVPETKQFTKIFQEKNPSITTSILQGYADYRGIPVVGALTMVPGTNWSYIAEVDEKEAYYQIELLQFWLITAFGGMGILTAIIAVIASRKLINPIKQLTTSVKEIQDDSTEFEINPTILKSNDEVSVLASALKNQMNIIEKDKKQLLEFKIALDEAAIVSILDMNERIVFANERFCETSKYSRDELLGKNTKIVNSGYHNPSFFKEIKKDLTSGKTWRGEIKNKAKDGTFFWLKSTIIPVLDEEKKISSYINVSTDITEQKIREETLLKSDQEKSITIEKQLEELKLVEKQKDEFVAMMSHELKTPLTPIKIYSTSLRRPKLLGDLNEKQMSAVESIVFNTQRLEKIVGDLLDAQKLELGKMKFDKKETKVDELMEMMFRNLVSQTKEKGGQIINHTSEKITINTDSSRLAQVLTNLINNAIDFIPKDTGKIEIKAEKTTEGVLFSVKDNGIGMTSETQKKLFKKFFQTDTSVKRKHGGTGLGLAICRGIVEALGGRIWVESQEGKGTNFYFVIPEE